MRRLRVLFLCGASPTPRLTIKMDYDKINIFASRNNELVKAEVYINGHLIDSTDDGGCWDESGLTGIKVPIEPLKIEIIEAGETITLEDFTPDGDLGRSQTILFNFDTMKSLVLKIRKG